MTNHPAVEGRDLTLAWEGNVILEGIDVSVPRGQFTAIIGPNGCGKSTLLKSFARILAPQAGQVFLHDQPIDSLAPKEVARQLAMLPQSATAPADITVEELVGRGRFPHQTFLRQWSQDDATAVAAAMQAARVEELAYRRVGELSGGQRQRVWLAMVLAQQTEVLLLDEPTTFLDIGHQYALLELVRALRRQQERTVVAVLHDLQQAVRYADHLIIMNKGAIIATGNPHDIVDAALIREVFALEAEVVRHGTEMVIIPGILAEPDISVLGTVPRVAEAHR